MTSQKKTDFAICRSRKINQCPFISGYICPVSPSFVIPTSKFGGVRICTSFRVPVPERQVKKAPVFLHRKARTLRCGVLDQDKPHIRIPLTRNPTPHSSWYPQVFLGGFTEPNRFPVGIEPLRIYLHRNTVRFGKSAQKYPWVPKNVWTGVVGTESPSMKIGLI